MLLATMLNYMDRQALSQQAAEIRGELKLSNEDYGNLETGFGIAFAVGGVATGFMVDRFSLRWMYPAVLLLWSAVGFATGWVTDYRELMICRVLLGFAEAGQWPCALAAAATFAVAEQPGAGQQHPPERRVAGGDRDSPGHPRAEPIRVRPADGDCRSG